MDNCVNLATHLPRVQVPGEHADLRAISLWQKRNSPISELPAAEFLVRLDCQDDDDYLFSNESLLAMSQAMMVRRKGITLIKKRKAFPGCGPGF